MKRFNKVIPINKYIFYLLEIDYPIICNNIVYNLT